MLSALQARLPLFAAAIAYQRHAAAIIALSTLASRDADGFIFRR